jgi:thioredoxin-like negative regulator of GroEL
MNVVRVTDVDEFNRQLFSGIKFVLFISNNCKFSISLETFILQKLSNEFKNIVFLIVDIQKCSQIALENEIQSWPTMVVFKHGIKVAMLEGALKSNIRDLVTKYHEMN